MAAPNFQERRTRLMQALPDALILLPGNNLSPMNYRANEYPFRQDSTFFYYTGIDRPRLALMMDAATGTSRLYGEDRTLDEVVWMGEETPLVDLAAGVGIEEVHPYARLEEDLRNPGRPVHYLPPYRASREQLLADLLGRAVPDIRQGDSSTLIRAVAAQRSKKDAYEQMEMERAVDLTGDLHKAAMQQARVGQTEAATAGLIEGMALAAGKGLGYPAIVTTDGHILHNHHHGNTLQPGDLLLIDAGAQIDHYYTGDITRTFPVDARFSEQQRAIYEIVLAAQKKAIEQLRPGVLFREVHLTAARTITEGLQQLGLMQGDPAEAVANGAHALFFPHGLGHHIGLDVHDMEDLGEEYVGYDDHVQRSTQFGLSALRLGKALEEANVVTIEPGIYFIPPLIDRWHAEGKHADFICYDQLGTYRDFGGIRIEDDILITADGYRVLGEPIPKEVKEVEALRGVG